MRYDMSLELDTLLSRLPYKRMMQDMLPSNPEHPMPSLPYVTRVYEGPLLSCTHVRACVCSHMHVH